MKKGNWRFYSINGHPVPCTGPQCQHIGDFTIEDDCFRLRYGGDHSANVKIETERELQNLECGKVAIGSWVSKDCEGKCLEPGAEQVLKALSEACSYSTMPPYLRLHNDKCEIVAELEWKGEKA